MTGKIAITPRSLSGSGHAALSALTNRGYELVYPNPGQTPTEGQLLEHIPECVGWLAGVEPIGANLLEAADELKVISRNGVGVDNIHLPTANARGIAIEKALGANARGVAELAIALMLAAFRHVPWSHNHLSSGEWKRRIGVEAVDRTLGIIGCGAIGRTVADLAVGMGMNVIGYDPFPNDSFTSERFRYGSLDDIYSQSSAISLHCPPSEKPLIDAQVVSMLRDGVVVVNTARAELVDDGAILAGLESGQISCLATDVFHQEPPKRNELLRHERVILTPHAGGFTCESVERATNVAVQNIIKVLESQ